MTIKETFRSLGFDTLFLKILGVVGGSLAMVGVAQIEQNNAIQRSCNKQTHVVQTLNDSLFPQVLCVERANRARVAEKG
jgi:hypothetical protein